ncbi:glucose-6-phosphate isomerase [Thermosipho melanesiensis]|uniref:Glucose-6-phosphate isomerase n=2 Tax=Thermosipho melanesiensis TaxID=46541 RepID=A6LP27_THEM4|nr:glucose-6-phosphate isomerase [Thermosipho melanesiensis]ABR31678.1 Glucose-6-phosphate isomerase [Thermosipho melanesiensis BI429]APT74705.1 glucose-6-phosphate isomerase [Thermosipho melanesiensis]OOC35202.1 glucose-6-phosphate isomerase [Thermosipho melanesiensis]OOC35412.1 glucose-6-phosphate isomerase [Thermosipho melanesiensis]OOC36663.1 glucose-6-phosphate isomerase [Thermosipho melanesiensis]
MLKFDFTNLFSDAIVNGISINDIKKYDEIIKNITKKIDDNKPGFLEIIFSRKWIDSVLDLKDFIFDFDNLVVLGIGGSALGNIALQNTLRPFNWNYLSKDERDGKLRIFVIDNVDPDFVASILDTIDVHKTLFNVISKSGTTAEAMSNYLIARGILENYGLNPKKHLIFTTDPEKGVLRKIANEDGIKTLEIPQNVGGRFSVLTPVGLLSAYAAGINIESLYDGAKNAYSKLSNPLMKNPAALIALTHYLYYNKGRNIAVMMAYSNKLYYLADWYRQLWAESLGKKFDKSGNEIKVGQTPVKALGAVDQHSQVQLYNEGPDDKIITFLKVEKFERDIKIPSVHNNEEALSYLQGNKLSALLNNELKGTENAILEHGKPSMKITFPQINELHVGEFFMTYELATTIAGELFNVNPFDQPGVELGKKITYALMGRKGFEEYKITKNGERIEI